MANKAEMDREFAARMREIDETDAQLRTQEKVWPGYERAVEAQERTRDEAAAQKTDRLATATRKVRARWYDGFAYVAEVVEALPGEDDMAAARRAYSQAGASAHPHSLEVAGAWHEDAQGVV